MLPGVLFGEKLRQVRTAHARAEKIMGAGDELFCGGVDV